MNHFANLEISLLQIAEDESDGPISFAFHTNRKPPLVVSVPRGLAQLSIGEPGGTPVSVSIASLASPGRAVAVGSREVHVQFLRAANPLCRGPLLVFEEGDALPCFPVKRGLWQRLTRAKEPALVPVFLVGTGDEGTRRREIQSGLNVALKLVTGELGPGLEDEAYLA